MMPNSPALCCYMAQYELLVLGSPTDVVREKIVSRLKRTAQELGLNVPDELTIRPAAEAASRDISASTAVLYFGGDPEVDAGLVYELEAARIPIVPVVPAGRSVSETVPGEIRATNAFFMDPADDQLGSLIQAALECLGLLRRQRWIFVSCRRDDSRNVAVQLHDELSGRGFDVFLDTHDVLPGDHFQEMLWHSIADCDVVIMLGPVSV